MIEQTIRRLIDNAPEIDNPIVTHLKSEVAANAMRRYLECQVVLKSGYSMAGVLTYAADGTAGETLQLVAVAQTPDKRVMLAEHFFTYDDVATIVVGRPLPDQLVKPVRNGGPIILGH